MQKTLVEAFGLRVSKSDACWLWTGGKEHFGHGRLTFARRRYKAHRLAWEIAHGPIPDGMRVLHRCDVPACVRPSHLFIGTDADNARDMHTKGRCRRTLTDDEIRAIRAEYGAWDRKVSLRALAEKYEVDHKTVHRIVAGKGWLHVR
jgi:hypothetical protein